MYQYDLTDLHDTLREIPVLTLSTRLQLGQLRKMTGIFKQE